MVLWKYSFREVVSRRGRAIMTLASIVIAVATVVSVSVATNTTRRAYQEMFASVSGRASLEIAAEGGGGFDDSVLAAVEQTPGVKMAVPMVQRPTSLRREGRKVYVYIVGIDPAKDKALYDYKLVEGRGLDAGEGVLLEASLARSLGIGPGDDVTLMASKKGLQGAVQEISVLGTVTSESAASLWLGGMIFMPLEQAQDLFAGQGQVDMIEVILDDSADQRKVMDDLARRLPVGLTVGPPRTRTQVVEETLTSSEQGLKLASAFSLVLAYFMILNTFLMNVSERRRQLAIMRAVGATQKQISRLLYGEALAMGVVGTGLGILLGLGGAYLLNKSLSTLFLLSSLPPLQITATPLVLAALFGLGVSFIGVAVPARRASRLTPLEGMSRVVHEDMEHASHKYTIAGLGISLVSGIVLAVAIAGWLPTSVAIGTSVFVLVGVVLLVPVVLGPFAWTITRALFPRRPAVAGLAYRQVLRHRTRSALTVGVLFVASATGIGLGCTILDNIRDVEKWHKEEIAGDFIVRAMPPNMATGMAAHLPEELGEEIRRLPGVAKVGTACFAEGEVQVNPDQKQPVAVIVREFPPGAPLYLNLGNADQEKVRRGLEQGGVVIGTVLAQRTGLRLGGEVTLAAGGKTHRLPIVGLTNEYLNAGLTVHIRRDYATRLFGIDGIDTYIVVADRDAVPQVQAQLDQLCRKYGVVLQSIADISRMIDKMAGGIRACLWGILVLGFIVAAFGVVNTLTMNMMEQTREFGLLRAVAMTRRQVRRTILAQAAILAGVGLIPGSASGIFVAYLINLATMAAVGHPVAFGLHPTLVLGSLLAAFAIVLIAALVPAQRAARLNLLTALQYE
jgi:putative ABC transport system permease protein